MKNRTAIELPQHSTPAIIRRTVHSLVILLSFHIFRTRVLWREFPFVRSANICACFDTGKLPSF